MLVLSTYSSFSCRLYHKIRYGVIKKMIAINRLNGEAFLLNADLIETLESTPDTVIKLTSGKTLITQNSIEDIVRKTIKYKQLCNQSIQVIKREEKQESENDNIT